MADLILRSFGVREKEYRSFKLVVIGDHFVGKSSLVDRMTRNRFDAYKESTIGCAYSSLCIQNKSLKEPFLISFWDTAGQEKYQSLASFYLRGAHIVLLCFDPGQPNALRQLKKWCKVIDNQCLCEQKLVYFVQTKSDMKTHVADAYMQDIEGLAFQWKSKVWVTSAKTGEGIQALINNMTFNIDTTWGNDPQIKSVQLDSADTTSFGSCCS